MPLFHAETFTKPLWTPPGREACVQNGARSRPIDQITHSVRCHQLEPVRAACFCAPSPRANRLELATRLLADDPVEAHRSLRVVVPEGLGASEKRCAPWTGYCADGRQRLRFLPRWSWSETLAAPRLKRRSHTPPARHLPQSNSSHSVGYRAHPHGYPR